MVGLVDVLEAKDLVARRPQEGDRRRNVVELTETGRDTLRRASAAATEAERQFLALLSPAAAAQFTRALRALVPPPGE
jgi:DNA-binding MarR family transcriptional regulator